MLSCLLKVLTKIMAKRIIMAVDDSGLAGELINGFHPKQSCSDNVFILNYKLPINVQKTFLSFLLFVDLIAAYNMVDRKYCSERCKTQFSRATDYLPERTVSYQLPVYQSQPYQTNCQLTRVSCTSRLLIPAPVLS